MKRVSKRGESRTPDIPVVKCPLFSCFGAGRVGGIGILAPALDWYEVKRQCESPADAAYDLQANQKWNGASRVYAVWDDHFGSGRFPR